MNKQEFVKPVYWMGSSLRDIRLLPKDVRDEFGFAIYRAQTGGKHEKAKPLRGYHGTGVIEVVADFSRNTYRAVYTVKFFRAVYVLHVFQKKSKSGIATPKVELDLIKQRLKFAEQHHSENIRKEPQP